MTINFLKLYFLLCFSISPSFFVYSKSYRKQNEISGNSFEENRHIKRVRSDSDLSKINGLKIIKDVLIKPKKYCWITLNAKQHFETMDQLDGQYAEVLNDYQRAIENDNFDEEMLDAMLNSGGAAPRAVHQAKGDPNMIPAGINLGGCSMMRVENSLLFFYRMKLRNNTHFRVNYLHSDLINMVLTAKLSLNDLHLLGAYERVITDREPSNLFYTPSYGQVEFLLKRVEYKMEGRYRLLKDRLIIELIISEIEVDDIMMTYCTNTTATPKKLQRKNIDEFLERMKVDLDKWLKDFFNDYLMYFGLSGAALNAKIQQYDKEKAIALNDYTDNAIDMLKERLHALNAASVKIPDFVIYGANAVQLKLKDGVIRGLDSMYRRSIATGRKENTIRKVNAIVGFSNLKVMYNYDAIVPSAAPPLSGKLILSADELSAHMGLSLLKEPETVDLYFDVIQQMKPESLTLEGPANRVIANFRHIIEHHVIAIMTNTLLYNVKMLGSLTKCDPPLLSHLDSESKEFSEEALSPNVNNAETTADENTHSFEINPSTNIDVSINEDSTTNGNMSEEEEQDTHNTHMKVSSEYETPAKPLHAEKTNGDSRKSETENSENPDYVLSKKDSVELELMPEQKLGQKQKILLKHNERFTLTKLKS